MPRVKLVAATVPALLQRGGWPAERLTADTWRSTFRGRTGSFPVFVRVDHEAGWVHFAIVPFLRSPEDEDGAHRLYTRLMQLNQQLLMAKFSIDDDLDVVLSVEYPIAEIDDNEFADALDVLSYYADRHHAELAPLGRPG